MIGFFPTPYPDELLYSIVARYYVWSANTSPKVALEELFGRRNVVATFDLPSHIESLVENLPFGSKHTIEGFIQKNTLYPFYSPFLPPKRAEIVLDSMGKHFSGDIHTRVGIMAGAIPQIKYFRFCPICLREDIENFGEPYWHRIHQIVGLLICPIHQVWLQNSVIKVQGENRHEFYASDIKNCISKPILVNYNKKIFDNLFVLSQDVDELLKREFKSKDGKWFQAKYQSLLIDRGLATASGRIHQRSLAQEFNNFYEAEFLRMLHSTADIKSDYTWLTEITRKHRKAFHPLRHLLLIRFLGKSVLEFFEEEEITQHLFGAGPWICFNGASNHYLQKNITSVAVSYSSDVKKLIGTFSCACGFTYSTSDVSIPNSKNPRFAKIKAFGKIWERKLTKLLIEKKVSLREVSRQLKVAINTIIRHGERLKIIAIKPQVDSLISTDLTETKSQKKDTYREIWRKTRKENPTFSKTLLRKKNPAVFIWLYRNDGKWLNRNSPRKAKVAKKSQRIDWQKRDELILGQVQIVFQQLWKRIPPVRITINAIGKTINLKSVLDRHLDKLPTTKNFLLSKVESVEQFQIRRIYWAANKIESNGEIVKTWKVMRFAGIKNTCSESLKQVINNIALEINQSLHFSKNIAG